MGITVKLRNQKRKCQNIAQHKIAKRHNSECSKQLKYIIFKLLLLFVFSDTSVWISIIYNYIVINYRYSLSNNLQYLFSYSVYTILNTESIIDNFSFFFFNRVLSSYVLLYFHSVLVSSCLNPSISFRSVGWHDQSKLLKICTIPTYIILCKNLLKIHLTYTVAVEYYGRIYFTCFIVISRRNIG